MSNTVKKRLKLIPKKLQEDIEAEVKMMLHASRDCLRNKGVDSLKIRFEAFDGHFGEAFGIMRTLVILGYGYFGSSNLTGIEEASNHFHSHVVTNVTQDIQNLRWWFCKLEQDVIEEEGWKGDHQCTHCLERYKKDDALLIEQGRLTA